MVDIEDPIPLQDEFWLEDVGASGLRRCRFFAFNTVITIDAHSCEDDVFFALRERCRHFERLFSRTLPHSEVTQINEAGGRPVAVSAQTYELVKLALRYCAESHGLFDVTIGAASRLWDFHHAVMPDAAKLAEAVRHVNWRCVQLDSQNRSVRLTDPASSIDLGGIAKGYIADDLAAMLDTAGCPGFLVNLGGNVYARGRKPDGAPWRVGIQDPRAKEALVGAVKLEDASAVTSGIYERCFVHDDTLYHHVLHPKTGQPIATDIAGVTVVAKRSIDAEGYSTTLLALGRRRARAFADEHPQIIQLHIVGVDGALTSVETPPDKSERL